MGCSIISYQLNDGDFTVLSYRLIKKHHSSDESKNDDHQKYALTLPPTLGCFCRTAFLETSAFTKNCDSRFAN